MERKEAIEVVKKNWPDSSFTMLREALETLIPELKESEDERIRKWIIGVLATYEYDKNLRDSALAWLEKQGDKDKLIKDKDKLIKELGEYKVKYTQEVLSQQLEKQAKKKSQRMISAEAKEALYDKPTWSEEDENTINNICDFIQGHTNFAEEAKEDAVRFLKSLKDRVLPQPKQEWSEEDETKIKSIIALLKSPALCTMDGNKGIIDENIKYLKSIRPQTTWKPSDEMLDALYRVIPENVMEKSEDEMLLDKLYQGLKYGKVLSEK